MDVNDDNIILNTLNNKIKKLENYIDIKDKKINELQLELINEKYNNNAQNDGFKKIQIMLERKCEIYEKKIKTLNNDITTLKNNSIDLNAQSSLIKTVLYIYL